MFWSVETNSPVKRRQTIGIRLVHEVGLLEVAAGKRMAMLIPEEGQDPIQLTDTEASQCRCLQAP